MADLIQNLNMAYEQNFYGSLPNKTDCKSFIQSVFQLYGIQAAYNDSAGTIGTADELLDHLEGKSGSVSIWIKITGPKKMKTAFDYASKKYLVIVGAYSHDLNESHGHGHIAVLLPEMDSNYPKVYQGSAKSKVRGIKGLNYSFPKEMVHSDDSRIHFYRMPYPNL